MTTANISVHYQGIKDTPYDAITFYVIDVAKVVSLATFFHECFESQHCVDLTTVLASDLLQLYLEHRDMWLFTHEGFIYIDVRFEHVH